MTTKNYNIQLELVKKTTFFEEIEIDFRIGQKKFLFLFIAAIVIVWKILEESHYGQLFYGVKYNFFTCGKREYPLKNRCEKKFP